MIKVTVANGNHAIRERSHRIGVTSDEAENAPRLRVPYGEDSKESGPPLKQRAKTHTASAQNIWPRFLGDGVLAERE